MTTKKAPRTTRFGNRKLNGVHKTAVFNLAGDRMIDVKLREVEKGIQKEFYASLLKDAKAFPAGKAKVLAEFGFMCQPSEIILPETFAVKAKIKTIIRPDGKKVPRGVNETLTAPHVDGFNHAENWRDVSGASRYYHETYANRTIKISDAIPLMPKIPENRGEWGNRGQCIVFASNLEKYSSGRAGDQIGIYVLGKNRDWISPKTIKLCLDWMVAANAADASERGLRNAMRQVLKVSDRYQDVLAVFPEAIELEEHFFGVRYVENPLALINDDMKKAIASNMKQRGVEVSAAVA